MLSVIKKLLCGAISVQMALMGVPAQAQPSSGMPDCSSQSASAGHCATVEVDGQLISYPLMNWTTHATTPANTTAAGENVLSDIADSVAVRGGFESKLLNLSAKEAAALATVLPDNSPWVVAQYLPEAAELRINVFKVIRQNGVASITSASFTPAHGDRWKAAGAYISPSARAAGQVGRNPFQSFAITGSPLFHGISWAAAKAAIGHAVRAEGAAFGLVAVIGSEVKSKKKTSGNLLRKRVTLDIYGRAITRWFIGHPVDFASHASAENDDPYCVSAPSASTCPSYAVAKSGLIFEEVKGGTFSDGSEYVGARKVAEGELVFHDRKTKQGWTLLAVIVVSLAFGFGLNALFAMAGAVAGGAYSPLQALLSSLVGVDSSGGFDPIYSSGGNFPVGSDVGAPVSGRTSTIDVLPGKLAPVDIDPNSYLGKTSAVVKGKFRTTAVDSVGPSDSTSAALKAVRETTVGSCRLVDGVSSCPGGALPRADQYSTTQLFRVWTEGGERVRSSDRLPDSYQPR